MAGVLYIASPVFFDYTAIGWGYVLLAFSFVPWLLRLFTRSVEQGGMAAPLGAAVLFVVGFSLASQCIVWYPIALSIAAMFVLRSRTDLRRAVQTGAICVAAVVIVNLPWVLPLIRYGDPLLSSAAVNTDVPLGQHLSVLNIFRGWGALYNWPYETAYPDALLLLTFLPPLVALSALLARRDRITKMLACLAVVPMVSYLLPRAIYALPFTAVVRDVSRFILFQALGSSLLIAVGLDWLLQRRGALSASVSRWPLRASLAGLLAVALFVGAYPVWTGELTGTSKQQQDIRLRALVLPREYEAVERELAASPGTGKAVYFPTGLFVNMPADSRFNGPYREFVDSYAMYSPRPGGIFVGDRRAGEYRTVASFVGGIDFIAGESPPSESLAAFGIRWVVVRRDLEGQTYGTDALLRRLDSDPQLVKRRDSAVVLFENRLAHPLVYASTSPVSYDVAAADGLPTAFPSGFSERRQVAFFRGSAYTSSATGVRDVRDAANTSRPLVTFRRVNPTRVDIRVDNVSAPFFLVLSETFDPRWHLETPRSDVRLPRAMGGDRDDVSSTNDFVWSDAALSPPPLLPRSSHFVGNGYANAWLVKPAPGQSTMTLQAKFAPQSLAYVGFGLAGTTLFLLALAVCALQVRGLLRRRETPIGELDRLARSPQDARS
jgi:hypothetical protein